VAIRYPTHATLVKDTGFQRYEPTGVRTQQPKKKPRGGELSTGEKLLNRIFASGRVIVEHTLAGVKRCRIVKDVLLWTKKRSDNLVMEIACGLHSCRQAWWHPLPICDLQISASLNADNV